MSDKRKLTAEIDRCLKKVTEGVDAFEDIWKKAHQSNNSNQKEKLESDLKKEIKKLQRYRDQIKSWLVSQDVKEKQQLLNARKIIETQMEKFKVIEKETKTKAYSKEGLITVTKVDPKEKEKEEILSWVSNAISSLNIQYEKAESDAEALTNNKKKKMDKEDQTKLDLCKMTMEKHSFHINKLEAILRLVDNDAIEFDQIQSIKDNVEFYVENQDMESDGQIYDDLDLEELGGALKNDLGNNSFVQVSSSSPSEGDNDISYASALANNHSYPTSTFSSSSSVPSNHNHSFSHHSSSISISNSNPQHKGKDEDFKRKAKTCDDSTLISNTKINYKASSSSSFSSSSASSSVSSSSSNFPSTRSSQTPTKLAFSSSASTPGLGYAQVASSNYSNNYSIKLSSKPSQNGLIQPLPPSSASLSSFPPRVSLSSSSNIQENIASTQLIITQEPSSHSSLETSQPVISSLPLLSSSSSSSSSTSSLSTSTSNHFSSSSTTDTSNLNDNNKLFNGLPNGYNNNPDSYETTEDERFNKNSSPSPHASSKQNFIDSKTIDIMSNNNSNAHKINSPVSNYIQQQQQQQQQYNNSIANTQTIRFEPIMGFTPLGTLPLTKEQKSQKEKIESASKGIPLPCDSEKMRIYLPSNPCSIPNYYPHALLPIMNLPDFFNRLDPETLFFVFYYMEGTKAQYLAARALKQKSWRFHTKYMMWFQRHEEPKAINEEFEQGTYIFFDYEKWCQRKKEGFKFEYKFLEDHELN